MSEYDNKNRGAAFTPYPDQAFILQGKLDINGKEYPVAVFKMKSKDGSPRLEIYQKMGAMFEPKQRKENTPDYSGPMDLIDGDLRVLAWRKMKDDKPYLSLQVVESDDTRKESSAADSTNPAHETDVADDPVPF